ncbi:aldo/keto reductase [Sphingobium sp.]|uniref:aldo/keto reductase n=1 Tax=Sphingobium sp. TaxID=1912891 RepID=UPI003BAFB7F0
MQYRTLGRTDIKVSLICLGTMTWGSQNSEAEAHAQLDYAIAQGVTFIDTAEAYPVTPVSRETQGRTEEYIGSWIAKRGKRDDIILATKVAGPSREPVRQFRGGNNRLDRRNIEQAIDDSLQRLRTDYVDLYQLHWPDRPVPSFGARGLAQIADAPEVVPIEETLDALAGLIKSGKVRHIGVSNETPWGVSEYLRLARDQGLPRIASIQNAYNLLNRTFEIGLSEFALREDVGLLAYSPLAGGNLTGKYLGGVIPPGSRRDVAKQFVRYDLPGQATASALCRHRPCPWPRSGADGARLCEQPRLRDREHHRSDFHGAAEGRHRQRGHHPAARGHCGDRSGASRGSRSLPMRDSRWGFKAPVRPSPPPAFRAR